MARPLRIEYSGACYHVFNRGNRHALVFLSDYDYRLFLDRLVVFAELYDVVIFSYCLMPNHYHLFLKTEYANLGRFMQSFITSFTLIMNDKYDQSGHLFQGRYHAKLVESVRYKNKLSRYIHLNPVKVKSFKNRSSDSLKQYLDGYKWSSYRSYLGLDRCLDQLNMDFVLAGFGDTSQKRIDNYETYVHRGLLSDNSEDLMPLKVSNIIGSEKFSDLVMRRYSEHCGQIDGREQAELAKFNSCPVQAVIDEVCKYFDLDDSNWVTRRKGADRNARKIAMYLAVTKCKKISSLASIGLQFGVGINGVTSNKNKCDKLLLNDVLLKKQLNEIGELLLKH